MFWYNSLTNEYYKGHHTKGYSKITNDIKNCDRLLNSHYRLMQELINYTNIQNSCEIRIKKWKLQKMLNISNRQVENLARELKMMGFLRRFKGYGGFQGNYVFELEEYPNNNPYVLLSECEYEFLDKYRPKSDKVEDYEKMHRIVSKMKEGEKNLKIRMKRLL